MAGIFKPGHYDFQMVKLILGTFLITGFGDGGIEFERPQANLFQDHNSIDGAHNGVSRINDSRLYCTITVKEDAASHAILHNLMVTQLKSAKLVGFLPLPFLMWDMSPGNNGEKIADAYAIFMKAPLPNKALAAGDRAFTLFLPNAGDPENILVPGF